MFEKTWSGNRIPEQSYQIIGPKKNDKLKSAMESLAYMNEINGVIGQLSESEVVNKALPAFPPQWQHGVHTFAKPC